MTSLQPRGPYSAEELQKLYPSNLRLQQVQIFLRHGERSPVSARFQNAGLNGFWPYCAVARRMASPTMIGSSEDWSQMTWRRRLETFASDDTPVIARGPRGEVDAVCNLGELTDKGRQTTWDLGTRLRKLYVDQLGFMPAMIQDADMIYLRATHMPRALESLQQTFWGLYPAHTRAKDLPPPTIITRAPGDETLYPNDMACRRFGRLSKAFAQRAADRWNKTDEMEYLNRLIGKWMPEDNKRVAVDSHPRLSGIMDTMNSTLAHGSETRLPKEFYDPKGRAIIEKIGVEEWFAGYAESQEYRKLGIGSLLGDVVGRMVGHVQGATRSNGIEEVGGATGKAGLGRGGEKHIKLALSGCHDTTLAAILASLGAFDHEKWPPYTSHVALELFKKDDGAEVTQFPSKPSSSFLPSLFRSTPPSPTARTPLSSLSPSTRSSLTGYYVRIRYNDSIVRVPGCAVTGKHLDGDVSFCTLEAFKEVVDKFTPKDWRGDCERDVDAPVVFGDGERAGF